MGTWGNGIKDNDISCGVYDEFFEYYNEGQKPEDISKKLIDENQELINDSDGSNDFWFALALAQWEVKALEQEVFLRTKEIIESGENLRLWRELDADEEDIKKRKIVLDKFLGKLQTEKKNPKRREKPKPVIPPPFQKGDCLTFKLANGYFGGALVLEEYIFPKLEGYNLIAVTRIYQANRPTINDIKDAEILETNYFENDIHHVMVWYNSSSFKEYSSLFEKIGTIKIDKHFTYGGVGTRETAGWNHIPNDVNRQIEFEKTRPKPTNRLTISDILKTKPSWKFWK